jgi:choloylglycine hydrolase
MVQLFRLLVPFLALTLVSPTSFACSSFLLESENTKLLAKNYDWDLEHGYVLINKRNMKKQALPGAPGQKTAQWTSQYGSTTFNQYGREFPNSGINEKGLAVEILWLKESIYPPADERPWINELQWVQYQLDNFATVADVLQNADKIRVQNFYAKVHYLTCDASGECATVEYLHGKLVTHSGSALSPKLITNNTQETSAGYLRHFVGFGGNTPIPAPSNDSLVRYVRAASFLQKKLPVTEQNALGILENVRQGLYTKWNIVYNLGAGTVTFRTLTAPALKTFKTAFNYSCKAPVLGFDLEDSASGDISKKFTAYTAEANTKVVGKSFATLGEAGKKMAPLVANYPLTTHCTE